jgi:DNA-binding FrmR family transcriptional regulator
MAKKDEVQHQHPAHTKELTKLNRVKGQLEGVMKMITEERYCPDILVQLKAISSSVKAIERSVLQTHMEHCVTDAINAKNIKEVNKKTSELVELLKKM